MTPDRLDQVIDDVLDRVASAEDRAWLDQRLATDAGVRERFAARQALFAVLDTTEMSEAPEALLPAVLREIAGAGGNPATSSGPVRGTTTPRHGPGAWLERFRPRPALAWSYAAAMAVVVVALVFVARTPPIPLDRLPVAGTIGAAGSGVRLGTATLAAADARLEVTAFEIPGSRVQLVVAVTPGPGSRAEVTIAVDPTQARLLPTAGSADAGSGWVASPAQFAGSFARHTLARLELARLEREPLSVTIRLESPAGVDTRVLRIGPETPDR